VIMGLELLIPSAKYIQENLQNIGKMPPVLYPLGSGVILDYLQSQYSPFVDGFTIIGYEGADQLAAKLTEPKYRNIRLITLNSLNDLAHTVYHGLPDDNSGVIINFADTIVEDNITNEQEDCFYYSMEDISDLWTFFSFNDRELIILDKPSNSIPQKGMAFTGVFRLSDSKVFKRCLEDTFNDKQFECSSFYEAIIRYNRIHHLEPIETKHWYDIGHIDRYYNSKLEVKAREFNHITIDKMRGKLKKTSDNKDKFVGEISWYLKIPSDIEYCRPRIFSYSMSYNEPYIDMEYYSYHTVHELFLYGNLRYAQWKSVFDRISFVLDDFSRYTVKGDQIVPSLKSIYLDKTISRLETLSTNPRFADLYNVPLTVNGIRYRPVSDVIKILKDIIPDRLFDVDRFSIIHGDMCFSNILIDDNFSFIKLIDPRGKFGSFDIYGDPRYDIAKLFHSVDGKYDMIIKDQFSIDIDRGSKAIDFEVRSPKHDFDLFELLQLALADKIGDQKDNIELIESLLFLSMIPLHGESENHQLAMLCTGLQILDRVCDIKEE